MNDAAILAAMGAGAGELSFLATTWGRLTIAAAIVIVGLILWAFLAKWGARLANSVAARTPHWIDNAVVEGLAGPIQLVPVLLAGFIAVAVLQPDEAVRAFTNKAFGSAAIVLVFWGIIGIIDRVFTSSNTLERKLSGPVLEWTRSAARWLLMFIAAAAVLEEWGVAIAPILAGLGIFGAAVALGAQDLFKNLIGGLVVLLENRFKPGDWILVDGVVEGTVEQIGFRSTLVRRFDKGPVFVPNAKLADNAVTNFSRMTHRRIYWKIGLVYSTTAPQLRQVRDKLLAYVTTDERYAQPPEVSTFVYIDSFNDSSIDLMLYCFTKTTKWGEWLAIKQELALKVKEIVEEAGSDFAFPSRSLYIADVPAAAERFEPPAETPKPAAKPKSKARKPAAKSAAKDPAPTVSEPAAEAKPRRTRTRRKSAG